LLVKELIMTDPRNMPMGVLRRKLVINEIAKWNALIDKARIPRF